MMALLQQFMELCGEKRGQIKKSVVMGFFDGVFESLPFTAVYYLFLRLKELQFQADGLASRDALIISAIFLVGVIGRWFFKYRVYDLQSVAGYESAATIRCAIGDHLKQVPMGYFTSKSIGDTVTTLTDDIHFMEQNASNILEKSINGVINVLVLTLCMLFFDLRIGIAFLIGALISIAIISSLQKKSHAVAQELKTNQMKTNHKILEYLNGITVYKLFPDAQATRNDMSKVFSEHSGYELRLEKNFITGSFLYLAVERLMCGVIIAGSAWLAMHGSLDIVKAAVLLIGAFALYKPLENLGAVMGMVRMMDVSMKRIRETQQIPAMHGGTEQAQEFSITLDNVSFRYEGDENIISDVSLTIPSGKMTAIVGPSGCGKTTLTRLMARFWDVNNGTVRIGGTDVRKIAPETLYQYFSIVFQNVFLFNDTIENNIRFGKPDATHEEVVAAAKRACCHDFIMQLENGYETMAGENGSHLSGGEKQRIAMARAILKDAPIVILDEATSSVDPENEWMMRQAIDELVGGKTVIMIAHKMRTIMNSDQIVVMENGRIHGIGTHDTLLQTDSIYQKFWDTRKTAAGWKI